MDVQDITCLGGKPAGALEQSSRIFQKKIHNGGDKKVKLISHNRRTVILIAVAAMLMAVSAIAGQPGTKGSSTLRVMDQGETHTGLCCSVWSDPVKIMQPEKPVAMTVTWSTDYRSHGPTLLGLSLNNGPCTFYGPAFLPAAAPENELVYASTTVQWVVMPGDYGLVKGVNAVRLCGGGMADTDSIMLGFYTLTLRLEK